MIYSFIQIIKINFKRLLNLLYKYFKLLIKKLIINMYFLYIIIIL